jgi:hypothetical protein
MGSAQGGELLHRCQCPSSGAIYFGDALVGHATGAGQFLTLTTPPLTTAAPNCVPGPTTAVNIYLVNSSNCTHLTRYDFVNQQVVPAQFVYNYDLMLHPDLQALRVTGFRGVGEWPGFQQHSINAPTDHKGNTVLHANAIFGNNSQCQWLLQHNASIDAANANGNQALHLACLLGHHQVSELLINHQANVNAVNTDNDTPLHLVCQYGQSVEIVRQLLSASANVDAVNNDRLTPLQEAEFSDNVAIITLLRQHQANRVCGSCYSRIVAQRANLALALIR